MDTEKIIVDMQGQIAALTAQLARLEPRVNSNENALKFIPTLASVPVSSAPTANGYVPFFINGIRINLLTGS